MKFIFPRNYKYNNKFLGIFDYNTVIFNFIWYLIVYFICSFFINSIYYKIFIFIILCFPLFLLSLFGLNNENILYVFNYLINFVKNRNIYLYKKF